MLLSQFSSWGNQWFFPIMPSRNLFISVVYLILRFCFTARHSLPRVIPCLRSFSSCVPVDYLIHSLLLLIPLEFCWWNLPNEDSQILSWIFQVICDRSALFKLYFQLVVLEFQFSSQWVVVLRCQLADDSSLVTWSIRGSFALTRFLHGTDRESKTNKSINLNRITAAEFKHTKYFNCTVIPLPYRLSIIDIGSQGSCCVW